MPAENGMFGADQTKKMKKAALVIFILSVFIGVFGYWGCYTKAGNAHYDEMAGMIPFFALVISGLLLVISLILFLVAVFKKKK
jgi:hypothetical protein